MAPKSGNSPGNLLAQAKLRLQHPLNQDDALQKLGAVGNTPLARRLTACAQTHPVRSKAFTTLAAHLLALAPGRPRLLQRSVMLYVPDGTYQMQVFAMEDAADNTLVVCCEDVLQTALAGGTLTPVEGSQYRIGDSRLTLTIEQFDGHSENPPVYINAMTGWNRKAMRITLPAELSKPHIDTTLLLCALSAGRWKTASANQ